LTPAPLQLAQPVQRDGRRDRVQPRRQRRLAAETVQPLEGADERLLREVPGEVVVPRQPIRQPEDTVYVGVVQRPLGQGIPSSDAGTVMPPLPGDSPTGTKSRTRRISTAPPAQAYQYPAANSARRPQNMPARVGWATSRVSHAITTATTRAPASSSRARPGVV